jgi:D-glycero-beta-D-manno-heptose-7-phosphate kinase
MTDYPSPLPTSPPTATPNTEATTAALNLLTRGIDDLSQGRVLVVGDMAIDEMVYGHTARLSREAPVLILHHDRSDMLLGAASNAANNLSTLARAGKVFVAGVQGDDTHAQDLLTAFAKAGIDTTGMVVDASRPTTTKSRISGIANHSITQQVVRIDRESRAPISAEIEAALIQKMETIAPQVDAILLSDYGLGVVTPGIIEACRRLTQQHQLVWTVDSQQDLTQFEGATIVTPNQPEAEKNCGILPNTLNDQVLLRPYGLRLLHAIKTHSLLITRGSEGMTLFAPPGLSCDIPVFNKSDVFDVTGAGDTVVATLTLSLAAYRRKSNTLPGWQQLLLAATLGNLAASIVVRRFGVATTAIAELHQTLAQLTSDMATELVTGVGATLPNPQTVRNWLLTFGVLFQTTAMAVSPLRHDLDVQIEGHTFKVQVAQNLEEFETGLMYRTAIDPREGMWFGLSQPYPMTMWMKHCLMSLDMVFVKDQRILSIYHNVPPCTQDPCPFYHSDDVVDGVLELPGGTAEKLQLKNGMTVSATLLAPPEPAAATDKP